MILQNGETNSNKLSATTSKSFECVDHSVGSDLNRLNHGNVSNIFFLHYLAFFPAFWTKPFLIRYFFDTHLKWNQIILQEMSSHIIRSSSVSSILHMHQVSFKLVSSFLFGCVKYLVVRSGKSMYLQKRFLLC